MRRGSTPYGILGQIGPGKAGSKLGQFDRFGGDFRPNFQSKCDVLIGKCPFWPKFPEMKK